MTSESRFLMFRQIHSIWSAYTFGIATSTVFGRFRIILRSGVGFHTSITASEMSLANSTSVALKLSGEYSSRISAPLSCGSLSWINVAPLTASLMISSLDRSKTTRRCAGEVELYRWMIARFAPTRDSNVRSRKSSRACTSTCNHTSSGARSSSISVRLKSNSVFDADGNPTSISLKPHLTSVWKSSSFWLTFIGTANAWLPSRRSTLHQIGAFVSVRLGHCRSGKCTGGNGRYFIDAFFIKALSLCYSLVNCGLENKNPTASQQWGSLNPDKQLEPDHRAAHQQRAR